MNTTTLSAPTPQSSPLPWSNPDALTTHGIMGPGIRLFRRISFAAKAAWVAASFLLPLCYVQWELVNTKLQSIQFSQKERLGVAFGQPLFPLLDAAQNWRRAATANAPDLAAAGERAGAALDKLLNADPAITKALELGADLERLKQTHAALAAAPRKGDSPSTFAAHTELVSAVLDLIGSTADNSNLTLDPDLDTYYLMSVGFFSQAPLLEALGQLRGTGNSVLRDGALSPERRDLIARNLGAVDVIVDNLEAAVAKSTKADPSLKTELVMEELIRDTRLFGATVRRSFLGAQVQGEADAYLAQANDLMKAHYEKSGRVIASLDKRLEKRITSERRKLSISVAVSVFALACWWPSTR
jgi:hypothetical protein